MVTQIFFHVHPYLGKMNPFLTSIFFRWVGSTTNQSFGYISIVSTHPPKEAVNFPLTEKPTAQACGLWHQSNAGRFLESSKKTANLVVVDWLSGGFLIRESLTHNFSRWLATQIFCVIFIPDPLGKMNPIWQEHMFQMGWFNHQLEYMNLKKSWNVLGYIPHGQSTWLTVPKR